MVGRSPIAAVMFGAREKARQVLEPRDLRWQYKSALSGMFAGFCYTNVAFVFDLLKVRKQFRELSSMSYATEIKIIYRTEGLRGFLRGYQGMMIRDAPGFAIYFTMYETMKRN